MTCYAVYVEKELVGKHVKSSKVKVLWQIAFDDDLQVHQVELRHSIVSGKREVMFDNQPVYANKALFQGTFEHRSKLAGHEVRVTVEDTFEGYLYDLIVDNVMFHRMPRKTLAELETLRNEKKTVQTDFAAFTGKSKSALDGNPESPSKPSTAAKKKDKPKDESLIELDWDAAVKVQQQQAQRAPAGQPQFNPFDTSSYAAPAPSAQPAYDPFAAPPSGYNSYSMPSAIPAQQPSFNASYQAPPQQQFYAQPPAQQQAYDPFSSFGQPAAPQYPPQPQYGAQQPYAQPQRPPQQQQQAYDPFGAF